VDIVVASKNLRFSLSSNEIGLGIRCLVPCVHAMNFSMNTILAHAKETSLKMANN